MKRKMLIVGADGLSKNIEDDLYDGGHWLASTAIKHRVIMGCARGPRNNNEEDGGTFNAYRENVNLQLGTDTEDESNSTSTGRSGR